MTATAATGVAGGATGSSSAPSQQAAKKVDVPTLTRSLKSNVRNVAVCRDLLLQLHARIFEESGRDGFVKFILNANGGVAALLATLENHIGDPSYLELALVFLCNLMHHGGRRNLRVVVKVVKKGGSRVCLSILNKHSASMRVVHPATMAVIALASVDTKMLVNARLGGTLTTLLALVKAHATLPREGLASVLSCLCSLARGEANLVQLGKKGSVLLLMEVCSRHLRSPNSPVLRWVLKALHQLCGHEDNVKEAAREGAVTLALHALYEQGGSIEIQKTVLDIIKILMKLPEGQQQFQAAGGYPYIVSLIVENNADKEDQALQEIVVQLYRFFGVVELPIGADNDVTWVAPDEPDAEGRGADGPPGQPGDDAPDSGSSVTGDTTSDAAMAPPTPPWDGDAYSPELHDGSIPSDTALNPDAIVVQHVKPFKDPRPSPSCASAIDFTPPVEELLVQVAAQRADIVRQEIRRVADPASVIHRVVYDDLPRAAGMPNNALNQMVGGVSKLPTLRFSSNFESGNLKRAIQVFDDEYDLILSNDVNTGSYCQWMYFGVEGMRADVTYKFNIINMEKPSSSFDDGQRLLLFSEKRFTWSGFGWLRTGHNIAYLKNSYKRKVSKRRKSSADAGQSYYTLTFAVRFPHDDDRAYLANCYPYTYSDLLSFIKKKQVETKDKGLNCFMAQALCQTQAGNPMPLITITSLSKHGVPCSVDEIKKRHVCVVSARVHPGETVASYCCKGLIDYLLDSNDTARWLRDNTVWKIIPMLNPDGVINGNHRCALSGKDLNREFIRPSPHESPTVYYLKELIRHVKVSEGRTVLVYGDFHGHSRRDNFFVYSCGGNKKLEVHGLTIERVFPRLMGELCPYFNYQGSSYKVQKSKQTTGRVVFYRQLGVRLSYTLEGSMMGGDGCDFLPVGWDDMSEDTARRVAAMRRTRAHFNQGHFAAVGAMFAKSTKLVSQAAVEGEGRVCDLIFDMLSEVAAAKQQQAAPKSVPAKAPATTATATPPIMSPVTTVPTADAVVGSDAEVADMAAGATYSGTYASNRRGSVRVTTKGAALRKVNTTVTAQDVQDVLGTMLKSVPTAKGAERRSRSAASTCGGNESDDDEPGGGAGAGDDDDEDEGDESAESSGESSVVDDGDDVGSPDEDGDA